MSSAILRPLIPPLALISRMAASTPARLSTPTNESGPVRGEIIASRTVGAASVPAVLPAAPTAATATTASAASNLVSRRSISLPLLEFVSLETSSIAASCVFRSRGARAVAKIRVRLARPTGRRKLMSTPSTHEQAAVNVPRRPGDVAGLVGREEGGDRGHLLGPPDTADGDRGGERLDPLWRERVHNRRPHRGRSDRVDRDPVRRELLRDD